MNSTDFAKVFINFVLVSLASASFGLLIFQAINKYLHRGRAGNFYSLENIGAATIIGLSAFAYLGLFVGLLGYFNKTVFLIVIFALLLIPIKNADYFKKTKKAVLKTIKEIVRSKASIVVLSIAFAIIGSLYLSAMRPPHTSDELHYHFPQVRQIVLDEKVSLDFGGHPFYGTIPKLMELIFAVGTSLSGYSLAHALNFLIFISFLLIVFGVLKKHYGTKTAAVSILLICLFDDFTWNATTGYIDAATTAAEIGFLLFILRWLKNKDSLNLSIAGLLVGVALSIKYSAIPTLFFGLAIILLSVFPKQGFKKYFSTIRNLVILALLFGGFWYLKNIFLFQNPFYPLYFGHNGISADKYIAIIENVQQFGPKTLQNFLTLIGRYKTLNGFTVYLSFFLPFLVIFLKKERKFHIPLLLFYVYYTLYWFFLATHQIRFLTPGIIVATLLTAILIGRLKTLQLTILTLIAFLCLEFYSLIISPLSLKTSWNNYWKTKFHLVERQYALGHETESSFLTHRFGCQFTVIGFLESNNLQGKVVDNWSVWHAPSVSFYATKNKFMTFDFDLERPETELWNVLKNADIKYLYFNTEVKERHLANTNQNIMSSRGHKVELEEYLVKNSERIYSDGNCRLFKIKL